MKNKYDLFGFIDESGTAGVLRDGAEFLFLSLVIFDSELEMKTVRQKFSKTRLKLGVKQNYEFHYSRNKLRVRREIFSVMSGIEFRFITFRIKKGIIKKHSSYTDVAEAIIEVVRKTGSRIRVILDMNPALYKELNKIKKRERLKNIFFEERNSKTNDRLQLVDYVVSGHARYLKIGKEEDFEKILNKNIRLIDIDRN